VEAGGDVTSSLKRLPVDNIIATHLRLRHLLLLTARSPGATRVQATRLAKRPDGAKRLHAGAIGPLATVRKLLPAGEAGARLRVFAAGQGS
jgi:hypothetical protein